MVNPVLGQRLSSVLAIPVLLGGLACNPSSKKAEQAVALCERAEDRLLEVTLAFADAKATDPVAEQWRLNLRLARVKWHEGPGGDPLILRCAQRMDEILVGATKLNQAIFRLKLEANTPDKKQQAEAKEKLADDLTKELLGTKAQVQALLPGR